jgi:hypothetical protein
MEYTKEQKEFLESLGGRQKEILESLTIPDEPEEIVSSSGEVVMLEPLGVALYEFINECNSSENIDDMMEAMDIFAGMYPEEYFLLLD